MRAYRDYIFIFNIYVPALLPCMLLCFPGAAIAAFALAVCLLCTSFLRGAALRSMTTVNQCRSILGDKVWMAHVSGQNFGGVKTWSMNAVNKCPEHPWGQGAYGTGPRLLT